MLRVCLLAIVTIVVIVGAAPETNVRWMEIQKSRTVTQKSQLPVDLVLSYEPYETSWESFKQTHGKSYKPNEEIHRYNIFLQNVAYIESHNKLYREGHKSFYLGLNHLADYEFKEFQKLNGFRGDVEERTGSSYIEASYVTLPKTVDWRTQGYVTPVKNQGQCGSCWSFSATGSLEGQHYKATRNLTSLSEQQLVDCSSAYGNHGCQGGLMDQAFQYIKATHGVDSEKSYPYLAKQEDSCHFNKQTISATCTGFVDIPQGSESALQSATGTVGPISVAIDAGHRSFQLYKGGVYDEPQCSPTRLDHGVLVVGYGTSDEGIDYWLVKNSWGLVWGNEGYIMMSRNRHNQCGIASKASYPLV